MQLYWERNEKEVRISLCSITLSGFNLYNSLSSTTLTVEEFSGPEAQKAILRHFSPRILKEIGEAVKRQAGITRRNGAFAVRVDPPEINFATRDRFGGTGTCCSLEEFLGGGFNDFIMNYFGPDTLASIAAVARQILHDAGKGVPPANSRILAAESLAALSGKSPGLVYSWEWGMDFEYNYSARLYDDCILWRLEMDEQWGGGVEQIVQSFDAFVQNGPPDEFEFQSRIPDEYVRGIREWIDLERSTNPGCQPR